MTFSQRWCVCKYYDLFNLFAAANLVSVQLNPLEANLVQRFETFSNVGHCISAYYYLTPLNMIWSAVIVHD